MSRWEGWKGWMSGGCLVDGDGVAGACTAGSCIMAVVEDRCLMQGASVQFGGRTARSASAAPAALMTSLLMSECASPDRDWAAADTATERRQAPSTKQEPTCRLSYISQLTLEYAAFGGVRVCVHFIVRIIPLCTSASSLIAHPLPLSSGGDSGGNHILLTQSRCAAPRHALERARSHSSLRLAEREIAYRSPLAQHRTPAFTLPLLLLSRWYPKAKKPRNLQPPPVLPLIHSPPTLPNLNMSSPSSSHPTTAP